MLCSTDPSFRSLGFKRSSLTLKPSSGGVISAPEAAKDLLSPLGNSLCHTILRGRKGTRGAPAADHRSNTGFRAWGQLSSAPTEYLCTCQSSPGLSLRRWGHGERRTAALTSLVIRMQPAVRALLLKPQPFSDKYGKFPPGKFQE